MMIRQESALKINTNQISKIIGRITEKRKGVLRREIALVRWALYRSPGWNRGLGNKIRIQSACKRHELSSMWVVELIMRSSFGGASQSDSSVLKGHNTLYINKLYYHRIYVSELNNKIHNLLLKLKHFKWQTISWICSLVINLNDYC